MDTELDLLLGTAINSLVKLEIVLFLHSRPGAALSSDQISARLRRSVSEVTSALDELSQSELIDRFALGTGKHVIYGAAEDEHVAALLALLHQRYHGDPDARSRIVRQALRSQGDGRSNISTDLP